jgi:hypothetical protein
VATRRERIVQAAVAALDGVGKPAGLVVHRFRARPLERETQLPAAVVYPTAAPLRGESETVERLDHDEGVERKLNLRVELRVQDEQPDEALDPLYAWVVRALRTQFEAEAGTLFELCADLEEKRSDFAAAESGIGPVGACGVDFEITYFTSENDPNEGVY